MHHTKGIRSLLDDSELNSGICDVPGVRADHNGLEEEQALIDNTEASPFPQSHNY